MSKLNCEIGICIRKRRKYLDHTQEKLAELSDLNVTFIGEIERGHCNPSVDTLHKIAQALSIPLSELIGTAENSEDSYNQTKMLLLEYANKISEIYAKTDKT